ncbi:hypothetical protein [Ruegeria sp. HKCCD7318]|uniref:hypothetical protein n=1 Tax=Ruegeria sp. HKCCD7318 TaxID=2683014 RepID=UPI001491E493|nr:hypothetical protein [Ruegeria sp. HKCCD7318]NOE33883.1 hypothetical protein [Ruegeria sp. HKCCD7318]
MDRKLFDLDFRPDSFWPSPKDAKKTVAQQVSSETVMNWGDDLPPLEECEVEIARIVLVSTNMDTTSVRAQKTSTGISYRIVDEYEEHGTDRFALNPISSQQPISMGQLISFIDQNKLTTEHLECHLDAGFEPDDISAATVYSAFYPQLKSWYQESFEAWRVEQLKSRQEEDVEDLRETLGSKHLESKLGGALKPFENEIDVFMDHWSSENPSLPGTNVGIGWLMRRGSLRRFVEQHCLDHGFMPVGRHEIEWNDGKNKMTIEFQKTEGSIIGTLVGLS